MSRCFPYPPPGYTLSKASNEALIESIKLQKEREKAKADRKKEKKREKKEKKKAKEEKAKQSNTGHLDQGVCGGKSWLTVEGGVLQKETKDDTELLERSSITEEHEQPVSSKNPSYSSDSTQNSCKRKRHALPSNGTCVQGNILRIRLSSQKHIQHDIKDREEQLCSTSGRTNFAAKNKNNASRADPDKFCPTSLATDSMIHGLSLRPDKELTQPNPFQEPDIISAQEIKPADSGSKRYRKLRSAVEQYRDLIENWNPPKLIEHVETDDEDWLFGSKHQVKHPEKKVRLSNEISCSSSSSLWWPRAQYLPDADVYALPYTLLF